jgi:gamma-glutamyl-gamma-aminobutyrate hydrolase PuuD
MNGFLLPGGGDSYSSEKTEGFNLEDFTPVMDIEQAYLAIYDHAYQYNIPLVGMCLGNQYHALSRGNSLFKLEGYSNVEKHFGYVQPGTMAYFMMLDPSEQYRYLTDPDFKPDITIKIDTAHNYAITNDVDPTKVGVYSEEGVVQSYCSGNHATFQFHPEHFGNDVKNIRGADFTTWNRQSEIFVNSVKMMEHNKENHLLAKYLHEQKTYESFDPSASKDFALISSRHEAYYAKLEQKLAEKSSQKCEILPPHSYASAIDETGLNEQDAICGAQLFVFGQEL